ncbi:helix-turn-helix domain-containing protein [Lactobacillus kefiranofaciens]|nr:helix-turn-helix domain-containing protein [Lactobacillus kefiranofaciens]
MGFFMLRKNKYSFVQKKWAVKQYLNGNMSAVEIAKRLNMPKTERNQILAWVHQYQSNQVAFLSHARHNNHYSKELKERGVQEYLAGKISLPSLANKYGIRSYATIRKWIPKYNSHIENQNYNPHPEVYMAKARKTTTQQERIQIVQYCLNHDKNYSEAAVKFNCSYQQVYSWTQKYLANGETGLTDNRGKHKQLEELTELDLANRRIKELERKLKEEQDKNEFLKKLNQLERMCLPDSQNTDKLQ